MKRYKLKDVCKIEKGKIGITKAIAGEYPLVVTAEERASHNEWHFDEPATIVPLVSSTGHGHASIKRLHYAEGKYAVGSILASLIPKDHQFLDAKYLYVYLTINKEDLLVSQMTGAANVSLTITRLKEVEVEIPDYNTQMKVVSKYERSEDFKDKMLGQIELRCKNLETLRQEILQDAITGRLSAQWRRDNPQVESAEILLEKIKTEKENLIKEGTIRKQKPSPPIKEDDIPFELPKGWIWCRLGEIIRYAENLNIHKELSPSQIINYLDIDSIDNRNQTIREIKNLPVSDLSSRARRVLKKDYIVYSTVRPYLRNIVILDNDHDNYIGSTGFNVFKPFLLNTKYIFFYLLSPWVNDKFQRDMIGFNSPSINNSQFESLLISIPPLAEQDYIVGKMVLLLSKLNKTENLELKNQERLTLLEQVVLKEMFNI